MEASLTNLAADVFGSKVVFATDDWFAVGANLLQKSEPIFIPDKFTECGKWMDGWETRRKRKPGHDWCIIKLGLPGVVHQIEIDTMHFTGNYVPAASVQGTMLDPAEVVKIIGGKGRSADPECITQGEMGDEATDEEMQVAAQLGSDKWEVLVPQTNLKPGLPGTSRQFFAVTSSTAMNYVRLNMFPDGGIARFRVRGLVLRDLEAMVTPGQLLDMSALVNGARAVVFSDAHYGHPAYMLQPGRGINMGDGWETARKKERGPILLEDEKGMLQLQGNDWAIIQLAAAAFIHRVDVDTEHFKGNCPESCLVEGALVKPGGSVATASWTPVIPRSPLVRHTIKTFLSHSKATPYSHIRLTIFPDGGIMRLRTWGLPASVSSAAL